MTGDELNALIDRVADDQASDAERQQLDAVLSRNAEARGELEAVRSVVRRLDDLPPVEPPPALSEEIMAAIRQRATRPAPARRFTFAGGPSGNRRRWGLVAGWAVAATIMAVAFLPRFQVLIGRNPAGAHSGASGAMVPLPAASWRVVARESSPGGIEAVVRRDRDRIRLDVDPRGRSGLAVAWDPSRLRLIEPSIPPASRDGESVTVALNCGPGSCQPLIFSDRHAGPASLTLIEKGGNRLSLPIPEP